MNRQRLTVFATLLWIITASTALANPPIVPWRSWERIARIDGAAAVRDNYRQALDEAQRELEFLPDDPSDEIASRRLTLAAGMVAHLDSWLLVESREIHAGRAGTNQFAGTVWPQLINYTAATLRGCDEVTRRSRAASAAGAELHWSMKMTDSLRQQADGLGGSLALLGGIAGDADRVRQAFTLFGGKIGKHASAEEFLAVKRDIPRLIQATPSVAKRAPDVRVSVSAARRESSRAFIDRFFTAVNDRSDPPLNNLIAKIEYPIELSSQELRDTLSGADIAAARYRFEALASDQFVVRIDGVVTARGPERKMFVRNLALRFRTVNDGLQLLSIGGLR